jgi:uncharacterized membrane protein YphA (DoxX/SURF4 family)
MASNILPLIRILLGSFFVFTSGQKIIEPYQNFLYVVQQYQMFPPFLEEITARVVPWVEFVLGLFLILGLWLRPTLMAMGLLITGFLVIISQALMRGIPLADCGCFGDMITVPPQITLLFDSVLLCLVILMRKKFHITRRLSLDHYFAEESEEK